MKKIILSSFVVMGIGSSAFAAQSKVSSKTLSSALEVLNLPSENRKMLVTQRGEDLYSGFVQLAFDEKHPMAIRWKALVSAAQAKGTGATPELIRASNAKEWFMRNAALVALHDVNPLQGQVLAKRLLKDKALVVRSAAVDVLKKDVDGEVRQLLWKELDQTYNFKSQQSLWIRGQIVEALAQKPHNGEAKTFVKLLGDKDQRVHMPAVKGLERLTGVKLGSAKVQDATLVKMWQDYASKEKIEL